MTLITHHQSAEGAEPSKEPLDPPTALVATQGAAILGLGAFATALVRSNHLDAQLDERFVQGVSIVGAVPDEPLGEIRYEA